MRALVSFGVLALLLLFPAQSKAEDSQADSLSILPWTTGSLVVSSKDKRGVVQASLPLDDGYHLTLNASAPLDEDGRVAAFADGNDLIAGFKIAGQFGWDSDSRELAEQEKWLKRLDEAMRELTLIKVSIAERMRYLQRHSIADHSDAGITAHLRNKYSRWDGPSVDDLVPLISSLSLDCSVTDVANRDPCFELAWVAAKATDSDAYSVLEELSQSSVLGKLPLPDDLKSLVRPGASKMQVIADNLGKVEEFLKLQGEALKDARRNMALATTPRRACTGHGFFLDVAYSFDRKDVLQGDLTSAAESTSIYELTAGLSYTLLPRIAGLRFNFRGGLSHAREGGAKEVEICSPGGDPAMASQRCSKALFRAKEQPEAETTGYLRAAVNYQPGGKLSDGEVLPGFELRGGVDGIGDLKKASGRFSFFATPLKGNTAGRFGLAIEVSYTINRDPMDRDRASRWEFIPLAFVGATFSDLFEN